MAAIKLSGVAQESAFFTKQIDEMCIVNVITKLIFNIDEPLTSMEQEVISLFPAVDGLFQGCSIHEAGAYLRTFAKWELMDLVDRIKILCAIELDTSLPTIRLQ